MKIGARDNANHPNSKVKYYIREIAHYVRYFRVAAAAIEMMCSIDGRWMNRFDDV